MAFANKATYEQIKQIANAWVAQNKISNPNFTITRENTVGLLDKIGKILTIEGVFIDRLGALDGEYLSFGKTIEEYAAMLVQPEDYSKESSLLENIDVGYLPPYYSYTLGRKKFRTQRFYNDMERAFHNEGEFGEWVALVLKKLYDSVAAFRYSAKKQLLGRLASEVYDLSVTADDGGTSSEFDPTSQYNVGVGVYEDAENGFNFGIIIKAYDGDATDWEDAIAKGFISPLNLQTTAAKPTDTATGEAFVKEVKQKVLDASFISQGNSLNGNSIGATEGLLLIVDKSVLPTIEVDVQAGAFHEDKVALPAEIIPVDGFGSATNVYAMLIDRRGVKLHDTYRAVRDFVDADNDSIKYIYHLECTAFYSRNTFVHVWEQPE